MIKPRRRKNKKEGYYYDFYKVINYISLKYKINYRDLNGRWFHFGNESFSSFERQDFWHWLINYYEITLESFVTVQLITKVNPMMANAKYPVWAQEMLKKIADEFQPKGGKIKFWIGW